MEGFIFIVFLLYVGYHYALTVYREKNGIEKEEEEDLTPKVKYTRFTFYNYGNLFRAYIYIGLELMRKDRGDLKNQQTLFLTLLFRKFNKYDRKEITKIYLNILRSQYEVIMPTIFNWLKTKSNNDEKEQLINLLCDLVYHNDIITQSEVKYLYLVGKEIGLGDDKVRAIVAIRQERLNAKTAYSHRPSETSSAIKTRQKMHTLGLSGKPTEEEIKKAYRDLAKKFHPDRFHNKTEYEKQEAHERFIAINAAYEFLMGQG